MPTLRRDRGNQWLARIILNGMPVGSKFFPAGRKKGPEWTAAKSWEVNTKQAVENLLAEGVPLPQALERLGLDPGEKLRQQFQSGQAQETLTASGLLLEWGESYLAHAERTMAPKTKTEKETVLTAFFEFCREEGLRDPSAITKPKVYTFLSGVADERSPNRANVYRKNLLAAWNWGVGYVENFPQSPWVIESIPPFQVESADRYVPPEQDVIKVLQQASGQDLVMLLTYYFTGGRRSELFRLSWEKDVRLEESRIRLTDHKGKNGKKRVRWYEMHPELAKAFAWWREARPCKVDNVFMQIHCASAMGEPFRQRRWLMGRLCERAGVKPFGFHGLRHKSAAITFEGGGLSNAQILMGHSNATTTNRYVRSVGLYTDQSAIISALGDHRIGQEGIRLLQKVMPLEGSAQEAFCNQSHVTSVIQ